MKLNTVSSLRQRRESVTAGFCAPLKRLAASRGVRRRERTRGGKKKKSRGARQAGVIHFRFPLTFSLICIIHCQHIASPRYVQELSLDVQRMTSSFFFPPPPPLARTRPVINHRLLLRLLPTHLHHGSERYLPVFPLARRTSLTSAISGGREGGREARRAGGGAKGDLWECVGGSDDLMNAVHKRLALRRI